ncbi:lipoprotein [Comamonas phosphati]|nr:lipoprotein [Comamonas phosphati]
MKTTVLAHSLAAVMFVGLVSGCAAPNKGLYSWNSYQTEVYSYLKSDAPSVDEQILSLEKGVQQTAAQGAHLPPGYSAHLGLLYLNTGRTDQAIAAWEQEKKEFPESAQYIDYLINNMKKNRS